MRCYHFGNFYLSSIQQGIQSAHAQMELFVKYQDTGINYAEDYQPTINEIEYQQKVNDLYDWAENHKTMVCLNGGALQDLKNIEELMKDVGNKYPWSTFYEDEYSLGAILTNIAIVLPEEIYDTAAKIRSREYFLTNNVVTENPIHIGISTDVLIEPKFIMTLTDFDVKLIELLNSCQLAR